jgi:hypothetical protein
MNMWRIYIMSRKTNYVIVVDFDEDNNYLEDQYLLGWNNMYDWFDTDTVGDEIIETDGSIKQNEFGLIEINRWVMIYVSDGQYLDELRDTCKSGNEEDINCTVCKIEKDSDGEWIVVPV